MTKSCRDGCKAGRGGRRGEEGEAVTLSCACIREDGVVFHAVRSLHHTVPAHMGSPIWAYDLLVSKQPPMNGLMRQFHSREETKHSARTRPSK
jgi:hypothetical protein